MHPGRVHAVRMRPMHVLLITHACMMHAWRMSDDRGLCAYTYTYTYTYTGASWMIAGSTITYLLTYLLTWAAPLLTYLLTYLLTFVLTYAWRILDDRGQHHGDSFDFSLVRTSCL